MIPPKLYFSVTVFVNFGLILWPSFQSDSRPSGHEHLRARWLWAQRLQRVLILAQQPSARDACHSCPRIPKKSLPHRSTEQSFAGGDPLLVNPTVPKACHMLVHSLKSPKPYLLHTWEQGAPSGNSQGCLAINHPWCLLF